MDHARDVRVGRKDAIDLYADFADFALSPVVEQSGEGCLVEDRVRRENESSADSISILRWLSGRDAVAIRPSGAPVLKKNEPADAVATVMSMNIKAIKKPVILRMTLS